LCCWGQRKTLGRLRQRRQNRSCDPTKKTVCQGQRRGADRQRNTATTSPIVRADQPKSCLTQTKPPNHANAPSQKPLATRAAIASTDATRTDGGMLIALTLELSGARLFARPLGRVVRQLDDSPSQKPIERPPNRGAPNETKDCGYWQQLCCHCDVRPRKWKPRQPA
jgi:hypothetical protein